MLLTLFFCSAIFGVMAFHPHVLWSHDFNMAATTPTIASLLKAEKEGRQYVHTCQFSEVPQQTFFCISAGQSGSCDHSQVQGSWQVEGLTVRPLGREVACWGWRISPGCSVYHKSKGGEQCVKDWSSKTSCTFEELQIALEQMGMLKHAWRWDSGHNTRCLVG